MAFSTFYMKQNDLRPPVEDTLRDRANDVVTLGNASRVDFVMAEAETGDVKVDAQATIVSPGDGTVQYDWSSGDTDTVGIYRGEWRVTFDDGDTRTIPQIGNLRIVIDEELA